MLTEDRRKQLDGIISQMVANKENDNAISFVVNDFKNKYSVQEPEKTFSEKTAGVLDMIFGGGKIGEEIGTQIAEGNLGTTIQKAVVSKDLTPEEEGFVSEGPSKAELFGSALQSAALFTPIGTTAKGISAGLRGLGMVKGVSAAGKIGSGVIAGELFDVASNLQQGKTGSSALTPGLGALIGGVIPAAGTAKNVIVRFNQRQSPRIINSLIKPLAKDFSYGKNPGRAVSEEHIIANNFDDLLTGVRTSRQKVGQEIGALSDKLSVQPVLSIRFALSPLDEAAKVAASQNNQSLLSRLNNVKRAITEVLEPTLDDAGNLSIKSVGSRDLENLTFKQVRNILGDIGDLTAFTGNPSDDKLVNSALKKVYGLIKNESLTKARIIDPVIAKRFEKLTEKYADLISAEVATKYRDKIVERQNLIGLTPVTVSIGSALVTAIATGGASIPVILAGVSGAALDKLASTPAFKTRLAFLLSKKTPQEVNFLFRKIPALSKFFSLKGGVAPGDVILGDYAPRVEKGIANAIKNPKLGLSIEDVSKKTSSAVQKTNDLTTKILKDLEGKTTVSKQYILDATNRPELKQVERDLIRQVLDEMDDTSPALKPLLQEARKYKSAEEFVKVQGEPVFSGGSEITKAWSNERMGNFGTIYRGRNELGGGIYITDSPEYAGTFGSRLTESSLKSNLKLFDIRESSKAIGNTELNKIKKGFDSYDYYLKNGGEKLLATDYPDEILNKIQNIYGANSTDILKKAGFDGIVADESRIGGQGGTVWNIFDAKNIKTKSQLTDIWNKAQKGSDIPVAEFAEKVKAELLPLKVREGGSSAMKSVSDYKYNPRYEQISLPDELRGKVKNYKENVYQSPIDTSAGSVHFGSDTKNYFGHTRIEDMADNKTRRVIEVQSDLYQKGNLEKEFDRAGRIDGSMANRPLTKELAQETLDKYQTALDKWRQGKRKMSELSDDPYFYADSEEMLVKRVKDWKKLLSEATSGKMDARKAELSKLQQYNDPTAHFRMIREEIKKAAQDGKTKLQFPTGETAMKIEGLGDNTQWRRQSTYARNNYHKLTTDDLKVGANVNDGNSDWIITDLLGDGKFKAVPKDRLDDLMENAGIASDTIEPNDAIAYAERHISDFDRNIETFDISGKVDTSNPIYKFYEKDVQRYLSKFGGKRIVDDKGVSWIEIPITKEQGKLPVEAFGLVGLTLIGLGDQK